MASSGNTTIQLYYSDTTGHVPTSANLANGELAINAADGKLFYKDANSVVQIIATTAAANGNLAGGAAGELPYQTAANTTAFTAAGTSGQVLISSGTGAPSWSNTSPTATVLQTANFVAQQIGSKLYFQYNGANVASLDSSGNFTTIANITAYGTP